jgi:redox-sensing transcriptional repressor
MVRFMTETPDLPSEGERSPGGHETPVPKAVVARLSLYSRELQHLIHEGLETTNSSQLGKRLGVTDAQVRKDLAYFGQFGYPGIGYRCSELAEQIRRILGTSELWSVALIGVGNLGHALLRYRGFAKQGFRIDAAFDIAPQLIGTRIEGLEVLPMSSLREAVQRGVRLAILTVPASAAQHVAEQVAEAGIVGVLNFAPVTLSLPDHVAVAGVDLAIELEQLAFAVVNRGPKG